MSKVYEGQEFLSDNPFYACPVCGSEDIYIDNSSDYYESCYIDTWVCKNCGSDWCSYYLHDAIVINTVCEN